jgi:phosphate transport system permease protein
MGARRSLADPLFKTITFLFALSMVALTAVFFYVLTTHSALTLGEGFYFILGSKWNGINVFGALPVIYGSLITSAIALALGIPLSLGVAIFLSELSPSLIKSPIGFVVEMLAAVPSVVYGLWGLFIFAPFLTYNVYPLVQTYLGFLPIFKGPIHGASILDAGIILTIMIVPIISSVSRDALLAVPDSQREAAYALGATRSEMIRISVLSYARSGILASIFLGFGRAFGETIAVTMVVGNVQIITGSLFSPGATLASLIATQYMDATTATYTSAIVEAGLVLLTVVFLTNFLARYFIGRLVKNREAASYI